MSTKPLKITGIIAAGGSGQRLGVAGGKQLLEIAGRSVAAHAVDALAASALVQDIVVVCSSDPKRLDEYARIITRSVRTDKSLHFVQGGDSREESVYTGISAGAADADIVAIHDGARPLLESKYVDAAIRQLIDSDGISGVVVGIPAVDTIKQVKTCDNVSLVTDTPERSRYWHAQTPQVFWREELVSAYDSARKEGWSGTDDASYVERQGGVVAMLQGSRNNIKITTPEDVVFVEALLGCKEL